MRAAIIALMLMFGSQAGAECSKLCEEDWWKTATEADVQAELDAVADVMARYQYSSTPLHKAAGHGSAEGIKALLDAGADPKVKDGLNKESSPHPGAHACKCWAGIVSLSMRYKATSQTD